MLVIILFTEGSIRINPNENIANMGSELVIEPLLLNNTYKKSKIITKYPRNSKMDLGIKDSVAALTLVST